MGIANAKVVHFSGSCNAGIAAQSGMKTILLADDNKNIREFCKRELEDEGYRVLLARDGREAAQIVQSEPLDLAILDLNMPVVNGWEAAERIRATAPRVPIMFFTAYVEQSAGEWWNRLATACVEKTEDLGELKLAVTRLLAAREDSGPAPEAGT
jgi:CheY-like chemotaxis protein